MLYISTRSSSPELPRGTTMNSLYYYLWFLGIRIIWTMWLLILLLLWRVCDGKPPRSCRICHKTSEAKPRRFYGKSYSSKEVFWLILHPHRLYHYFLAFKNGKLVIFLHFYVENDLWSSCGIRTCNIILFRHTIGRPEIEYHFKVILCIQLGGWMVRALAWNTIVSEF